MYRDHYAEAVADSPADARDIERQAIQRSIDLLKEARSKGGTSREANDALYYLDRLWSLLLDDLASDDNRLPKELRAKLISIGIWILKQIECIRNESSTDFDGLIDISGTICAGLEDRQS
jgi:flagellar biosynthesis activator protein FlaF